MGVDWVIKKKTKEKNKRHQTAYNWQCKKLGQKFLESDDTYYLWFTYVQLLIFLRRNKALPFYLAIFCSFTNLLGAIVYLTLLEVWITARSLPAVAPLVVHSLTPVVAHKKNLNRQSLQSIVKCISIMYIITIEMVLEHKREIEAAEGLCNV
ncbi:hypothetical protein RhiirA4_428902 [Rhizophagus irregularis]|uniref:Uncharacterized protein n=1 Tax=Rhizophagus irregularis TaxID=588596 RepID=A0A2I1HEN3_9GLOM|nr:hypothetical protein RhiirA4_428902 [Rhizophagus irregularis]